MRYVHRRIQACYLAAAILGCGFLVLGLGPAAPAVEARALQDGRYTSCVVDTQHLASPPILLRGEDALVQLSVRATCASAGDLHIVFVLDASGSMAVTRTNEMKRAVKALIQQLDMARNPFTKVGVVQYSSAARTLCQLTNETGRASACVNKVGASGGTSIDRGITEGLNVLRKGRRFAEELTTNEVMIVLSDGQNNSGCQPVKQAAGRAKSQGVFMISICLGSGCDAACLQEVASSPRYFYSALDVIDLVPVFERIQKETINIALRSLVVTEVLPENMEFVADSSVSPATISDDGKTLTWRDDFVPKEGITYTFRVRPLSAGHLRISTSALATYRDHLNLEGRAEFPDAFVSVFGTFGP